MEATPNNEQILATTTATPTLAPPVYPNIPLNVATALKQVRNAIAADPNYLQRPECNYPPLVRGFLEDLFLSPEATAEQIAASVDEYFGVEDDSKAYDILVRDGKRAYLTLTRLMQKLENTGKAEDSITRIKALAQLQERLLAIMEKAEGHRQIHVFKRTVMDIVDRVLTPDQRTQVMSQLEDALKA